MLFNEFYGGPPDVGPLLEYRALQYATRLLTAIQRHEAHRIEMPCIGRMLAPLGLAPVGAIPVREVHIALDRAVYPVR